MKRNTKKLIMFLLISIMLIILSIAYPNISSAWSSGSFPTTIGMNSKGPNKHKLAHNKNLYCIDHGAHLSSFVKNSYHKSATIRIEGNTATYTHNGKTKTTTNKYNGIMSYIFSGGSWSKSYGSSAGHYTTRQKAVYKYWNTWVEKSGLGLPSRYKASSNRHAAGGSNIVKQAEKYAEGANSTYKPAYIKLSSKEEITVSTTIGKFVGAIKVTYSASEAPKVTALDSKGNTISKIELYDGKGDDAKKISKIESGKAFYIKNNSDTEIKKVKIEVKSNKVLKTNIYILSNSHGKQRLAAVNSNTGSQTDEVTIKIKVEKTDKGDLKIVKLDKKTSTKLKGMKFKVQTSKGWLQKTKDTYKYDATFEKATKFEVKDKKGIELEDLSLKEKYKIWETKAPSKKYVLKNQKNYDKDKKAVNLTGDTWIQLDKNGKTVTIKYKNTPEDEKPGTLIVEKEDQKTAEKLKGMEFKIKTSKGENTWLQDLGNNKYKYDAEYKDATTFKIEEEDGKEITNLDLNIKYQVWETKTPSAKYELSKQDDYDEELKAANLTGDDDWIELSKDKTESVSYNNVPSDTISISGLVWEDLKLTKANDYNNMYDKEEEKTLDGITVRLMKKGSKPTEVASTKTADGGKYTFSEIVPKDSLKDYYIEFKYSIDYTPVSFNSENAKDIKPEGSRALASKNVEGVATTNTGTEESFEEIYGLSGNLLENESNTGLYNEEQKTLEHINLGLKKVLDGTTTIEQNIAYVRITIKGYTYTYEYGGTGDTNKIAAPTVSYQSKTRIAAYTRAFYPSDVAYSKINAKDGLKVYVGYRIDIKNPETRNTYDYKEITMHVTNLIDEFDQNRYELSEYEKNWTASGSTATIKDNYLSDIKNAGIGPGKIATKFIEFSVKHDAIINMLENPNGIIEEHPTKARQTSYHDYQRYETHYVNGVPVTKWWDYTTSPQKKYLTAPYLIFKLGEQRTITGKVFEDNVTEESKSKSEKLGNGQYDDKENIASPVKVELMDIGSGENYINGSSTSNLYSVDKTTNKAKVGELATTYTDSNGEFVLTGMVPGKYYLRFTYGDGTQKLYSVSDNKEIDTITQKKYKSTIVTSSKAKEALKDGNKEEWYKDLEGTNYSVAVDNLETRKDANSNNNFANVTAYTAKTSITVENTKEKQVNIDVTSEGEQSDRYTQQIQWLQFRSC